MASRLDRREQLVVAALNDIGYNDRLLRRGFPVWADGGVVHHDLVAFGRPAPQDMTTATILARIGSAESAITEALQGAVNLACPAAIVALDDELQLWSVSGAARHERVLTTDYDRVSELTGRYGAALSPTGLLGSKRHGHQLSLFPVDVQLLTSARATSAARLHGLVLGAMDTALASLTGSKQKRLDRAAEMVVGVIAALVIRDKFDIDETDPTQILDDAQRQFPGYFASIDLRGNQSALVDALFSTLGEGINYASLDAAVVSDVYEGAVVSEADRLRLGIYYTPRWLADAITQTLPLEALALSDLVVMDPACGSGTFLLSAYNRLTGLMPHNAPLDQQHDFARSHLVGFDSDEFAVAVAKLSLLLHAMPAGNSWDVQARDVLQAGIPQSVAPTVIVSNPPWKNTRSVEGKRHELADDFLRTTLAAIKPGGFIGIVLPAAWLAGGTSRAARRELAEQTTIFEVWRLTDDTFGRSSLAPCIVFAQARSRQHGEPFVFRRVLNRRESMERFRHDGVADEAFLSYQTSSEDSLLRGPLSDGRLSLPSQRLSEVATIKSGPVPSPPVGERGTADGNMWWIRNAKDIRAYCEVPQSTLIRVKYPAEFHRAAAHDPMLSARKLLVSAKRSPENPWRIKVALDRRGVVPRETLQMVVPKSGTDADLYGIFAILSSSVASCWIDAVSPKMVIEPDVLGQLPVPTGAAWKQLASHGERLSAAADANRPVHEILMAIERTVAEAYILPPDTVVAVQRHMAGFRAPEGTPRFDWSALAEDDRSVPLKAAQRTIGAVVDVREGEVKLWLAGVTDEEGAWMPLPPRLPGWLCTIGRTLEAITTGDDVASAHFEYQAGSYVEEIDQLAPLANGA
jgi:hypothetical protein